MISQNNISTNYKSLDENLLQKAVDDLIIADTDLKNIIDKFGRPLLWNREQGFHKLIRIILEQHVSLKSAEAVFNKLVAKASPLTPQKFLKFTDAQLKTFGFSQQKSYYGRSLANAVLEGTLDLIALKKMDNGEVRKELIKIRGIGNWTADIYLLMVLKRPDVWPQNDLALAVAIKKLKKLGTRPNNDEMKEISKNWKPWRAVAARMLWHYYLNNSKREK